MTAIVGVLNRRGVAFAADSAATHTSNSGQKITNHANKIFVLSKYYPVGITLYNNLDFMGIPWESVIKMYRDDLKKGNHPTLDDYIKSFWAYIKKNCLGQLKSDQLQDMQLIATNYQNEVNNYALQQIGGAITPANENQFFQHYSTKLDEFKTAFQQSKADDYKTYKTTEFKKYAKAAIDVALSNLLAMQNCPADLRSKFEESLFAWLCHTSHNYFNYTGLVFFGFGEKELFPSYKEYKVSIAIDNRIKYVLNSTYEISNSINRRAVIAPFAQSDVTNTVIRAVEDDLRQHFYDDNKTVIQGFRDEIVAQLTQAGAPQQLVDILNALDVEKYATDYKKGMDDYIQSHYIDSLIETIAYLSKEDLADIAESLVRMTCIKRHVTSSLETVGGPVDVAVITKGDGFIWMKRKHYFDPKLNPQFFERYNK